MKFLFYILHKIEKCRSDFKTVFKFYFLQFLEMMDKYLYVYFQNKRAETERSFLYDLFWKCCSQGQWHMAVSIGTVICAGRKAEGTQLLVGCLVSPVPHRLRAPYGVSVNPLCLTMHLAIFALAHKVGVGVLVCPEQGHTSANFGDTQD